LGFKNKYLIKKGRFVSPVTQKKGLIKMIVAVIGGSSCSDEVYKFAEQVGKGIAEQGGIVICGGLTGVMEAVCKGAKSSGGTTVGILPGSAGSDANEFVDIPIATGMGIARNTLVVKSADVVIAMEGSVGTLSEIGFALNLGKNVIAAKQWEILQHENLRSHLLHFVETPEDAVTKAFDIVENAVEKEE
jgi:uncharacterized protein (TIGR00725 family)